MVSLATWLLLLGLLTLTSTRDPTSMRSILPHQESFVDQCTPVPTWTIRGGRAVNLVGQNVTVIALFNSSELFARNRLRTLRRRLYQAGFPAITFMVINPMLATIGTEQLRNEVVNIPVHQKQPGESVQDILEAANDHILVLDRCGRMAYQLITPFSRLAYPYVKAAILSTYKENPCGYCNATRNANELNGEQERGHMSDYTSDAPQKNDSYQQSIFEPQASTLALEPQESQQQEILTTSQRSNALHREAQVRENGLTHSFTQNFDLQKDSSNSSTISINETSNDDQKIPFHKEQFKSSEQPVILAPLMEGDNGKLPNGKMLQQSQQNKSQEQSAPQEKNTLTVWSPDNTTKNWDWSESCNNRSDLQTGVFEESSGQSVEVVRHVKNSKKKKKRKYSMNSIRPMNRPKDESIGTSSNTSPEDVNENSMRQYANQTQKLLQWYQKQIENDALNEEKCETSNSLKCRIVAHYKKLLPWLDYRLAPDIEN